MWHRLAAFIIKYRLVLLLLLLAVTAFMGYQASKVELSYEFTRAIPTDNPKYQEYQNFRTRFGEDGNMVVLGVQTDRFFEQDFFNDYNTLVQQLEQVPAVLNVLSIPSAVVLRKDTLSGKLQAVRLLERGQSAPADSIRNTFYNLPFYHDFLYNPETKAYLMALSVDKKVINSKDRDRVISDIRKLGEAFAQKQQVELHYSGLPFIRTEMAARVQQEMKLFLILSFVLTAVILLLFFRSMVAVLASMAVVAVGVIWSVGTLVLMGYKISLLTALIPPLIVVIGIPNCVYFLNKYHTEYNRHPDQKQSLLRMVDRMGIVTLFTNLTAAIGFGVFFFTKSELLKEFGLVAGLNILGIFFISLIFIPALFSLLPPPRGRHTSYLESRWMHRLLTMLTRWVMKYRTAIFVATVLACVVSAMGMMRLQNVGHIVDDLPQSDKVYQDLKFFERNFRGVMPLEIVIDTRRKNGVITLPMLQQMDELHTYLRQFPEIGHTLSITKGIKFARQAYYDGDSSAYAVPNMFDMAFMQPYLRMKGGDQGSMFSKLIASFMDSSRQQTRISVSMADVGSVRLPELLDSIRPRTQAIFDTSKYTVTFTGTSVVFLEGSRFIINSLRESLILAFIMIFGCMIFLFRSWRMLLVSVVVNVVPLMITAGIMGWAGIPIKPSTVLVFSVALGITIDVTIRFLVSYGQEQRRHADLRTTVERTIHDTGISIIYTSLILIVGFGVFALSKFDGTKALGYLTSLTLFLAMVTNLTLQPALLMVLERKHKRRQPESEEATEAALSQTP